MNNNYIILDKKINKVKKHMMKSNTFINQRIIISIKRENLF